MSNPLHQSPEVAGAESLSFLDKVKKFFDDMKDINSLDGLLDYFKNLIFKDSRAEREALATEVTGTTPEPLQASPTLTADPEPTQPPAPHENIERQSSAMRATNMNELFIYGDSIVEGMATHAPHAEGQRGWPSRRLLDNLQTVLARPEMVNTKSFVIFCGLNDIWQHGNDSSINSCVANIESMTTALSARGIQPILCTIHEISDGTPEQQERVRILNTKIRELASRLGCPLIDYETQFENSSGGMHLSGTGYANMVEIIENRLTTTSS